MKVKDVIKEFEEEYSNSKNLKIKYNINNDFIGGSDDSEIDDLLELEVAHHQRDKYCTEYHITETWNGPCRFEDYTTLIVNIETENKNE